MFRLAKIIKNPKGWYFNSPVRERGVGLVVSYDPPNRGNWSKRKTNRGGKTQDWIIFPKTWFFCYE